VNFRWPFGVGPRRGRSSSGPGASNVAIGCRSASARLAGPKRGLIVTALVLLGAAGCSSPGPADPTPAGPPASAPTTLGGPLQAPKTSPAQDTLFFTDLARADPSLSDYVNANGNVALQALLTDGSAFCAFLKRDGTIDGAMTSVATGARGVESQTHLPLSVQTFNAIDSVALIALCPTEQTLIPPAAKRNVQSLEQALG
jgi:hypothetical protein